MIDPANIVFIIAFIVLPVTIGVWALMTRRDLARRGTLPDRRMVKRPPSDEREMSADSGARSEAPTEVVRVPEELRPVEHGHRPQAVVSPLQSIPAQETVQMPGISQVEPAQSPVIDHASIRRPLRFPRYAGRSAGVVKRLNAFGHRRGVS